MKTQKANAAAYWIVTGLLAFGMLAGGVEQLFQPALDDEGANQLRYPLYLLYIMNLAKIVGLIILLVPGLPLLKEWTYAGFFFLLTEAVFYHYVSDDDSFQYLAPAFFVCLTVASWYLRPANRKMITINCDVHGDLILIPKKQKTHF